MWFRVGALQRGEFLHISSLDFVSPSKINHVALGAVLDKTAGVEVALLAFKLARSEWKRHRNNRTATNRITVIVMAAAHVSMITTDFAVPQPVKLITFGVDFQIDRCELEFVGWGEGEETWGLGYFSLPGDFSVMFQKGRPWAYDQLESVLLRQFIREDGARMQAVCGGFDTGFAKVQRALYQYLRPRLIRRYFPMKGASQKWAPVWAKGRRDERITLFIIGTNRAKSLIYQRATISVPGPGYCHYPSTDDYGDEYFKQLLSEDSHTERDRGVEMQIFELPPTPKEDGSSKNEALDIRVGALAALYIRGPVHWEAEEKKNLATIPKKDGDKKQETAPSRQRESSTWMSGMGRGFRI